MPLGLIALALGGFGIGLTEFVIMGLLPEVAADFHVSEATAGWLISGYALAVVVGALLLTSAVTRFERKPVLALLMVLFIAGNLISAVAPGYWTMMAGRITAALAHGAIFGIGVLALVGILTLVPKTGAGEAGEAAAGGLGGELRAFRSGQVWLPILVTILGYGGIFGAFTYIAFTLTKVTGFSAITVPWLLILFGVGLFIGNTTGGKPRTGTWTAPCSWSSPASSWSSWSSR